MDGIDVRDVTVASLRAQIGIVLQDTVLFAGTVRDNLTLGAGRWRSDHRHGAARLPVRKVSFVPCRRARHAVGERGVTLSNGQRQRWQSRGRCCARRRC